MEENNKLPMEYQHRKNLRKALTETGRLRNYNIYNFIIG